jgi:hypothetical protein
MVSTIGDGVVQAPMNPDRDPGSTPGASTITTGGIMSSWHLTGWQLARVLRDSAGKCVVGGTEKCRQTMIAGAAEIERLTDLLTQGRRAPKETQVEILVAALEKISARLSSEDTLDGSDVAGLYDTAQEALKAVKGEEPR